jgi:predicted Zn-dependent peptidase
MAISHSIEKVTLSNGAKGLLVHVPAATVTAYALHFKSGPDKATRAYPFQIAHTLEHITEAGPDDPRFPKKAEYLQELQKNGAWRNAYTGEYGISYVGDCVPDELLRILSLRLRAAEKPKLTAGNLKSESGNVMEEMRQRVADYIRLATALSRKEISSGAWQTSKEAMADAASVTLEQVQKYHEATHTIDNFRFIVVGEVSASKEAIISLFENSALPSGNDLTGPAPTPADTKTYRYEHRASLENIFTNFAMAIPRKLSAQEEAAMEITINILCNTWDSRILGKARDAGLCYSMRGSIDMVSTQTIFAFDTPIGPDNAPEFFKLMSSALTDLAAKGPSADEVEKARTLLVGQQKKNGQTTLELLNMYSEDYFGLDQVVDSQERVQALESVTGKEITSLVKEFLHSSSQVFSGVGSIEESDFAAMYEKFSKDLNY